MTAFLDDGTDDFTVQSRSDAQFHNRVQYGVKADPHVTRRPAPARKRQALRRS